MLALSSAHSIARQFGVSLNQAKLLDRASRKRIIWKLRLGFAITMFVAVLLLWLLVTWLFNGNQQFNTRPHPVTEYLFMAFALAAYLGYLLLFALVWVVMDRHLIMQHLKRCATDRLCLHCLYSVEGLAHDRGCAICPECGKESPVAPS